MDPLTETGNFGGWFVLWTERSDPAGSDFVLPVLEELFAYVKFDCEISRRDSLDVPLNVVILLCLLNVVQIIDNEEGDEHDRAAKDQSSLNSAVDLIGWDQAANLHEHLGLRLEAWARCAGSWGFFQVLLQVHDLALLKLLVHAVSLKE